MSREHHQSKGRAHADVAEVLTFSAGPHDRVVVATEGLLCPDAKTITLNRVPYTLCASLELDAEGPRLLSIHLEPHGASRSRTGGTPAAYRRAREIVLEIARERTDELERVLADARRYNLELERRRLTKQRAELAAEVDDLERELRLAGAPL